MRASRLMLLASLWTSALAVHQASAVVPPEGVAAGREPVRVRTTDPAMQRLLSTTPAWRAFTDNAGAGWQARFDEITYTPHRMWGPGLDLGPVDTREQVDAAVLGFADKHAELLGVEQAELRVHAAMYVERTRAWYVHVDVLVDGLRTWRSGLTFRFSQGRLTMVGADTYPGAPVVGERVLTADQALDAFVAGGPAPWAAHERGDAELLLLPEVRGGRPVLRTVWRVTSRTEAPVGRWIGFVDARDGEVVAFFNDVRFLDGALDAEIDARIGDGSLVTTPLRNATLTALDAEGATVSTQTDDDGLWSLPGVVEAPITLTLQGSRLALTDRAGDVSPALDADRDLVTSADFEDRQAALSTFHFVQQVQDFAVGIAPEVSWTTTRARAFVNVDDVCNAWFDGNVNFLRSGGGCRNTGRLADVVFHEWGHGFHVYSLFDFRPPDGSVGEGAADTMSFLLTDDSRIAPEFFEGGNRALRDVNNNRRYPQDYSTNEALIHQNGLLFGGSMWDTREALRRTVGEPAATETLARLYALTLKANPTVETAYDEMIFADDDDADLSNGTPHQCEIVEGFGRHALGPVGGFGTTPSHVVPDFAPLGQPAELTWTAANPAPQCIDLSPSGGTVLWRPLGGEWRTSDLSADGDDVLAALPTAELPAGQVIEYYAEVVTEAGAQLLEPSQGPIRPHTTVVGEWLEIDCNDFEKGRGGFKSALLAGEDVEGANDWQWGTPIGLSGDPAGAYSGDNVWGNDLGGGEYNGAYQDDRHNELRSPVYQTGHYQGVFLRYMRWLSVEDGFYDQALILADDEVVWSNWATDFENGTDNHVDDRWEPHVVPLGDATADGEVQIAWQIVSDGGLTFGGWNLDDVCLYAPATADNRLGISDFVANRGDGTSTVDLSWTMPKHAPVSRVRVVKQRGAWPTGAEDGEVVFETDAPEVGQPATATDDDGRSDLYYAVYGYDGDAWLSWTVEGWNAAAVDPAPGGPGTGCGCSASPTSPPFAWMLLGLTGLLARRRRA